MSSKTQELYDELTKKFKEYNIPLFVNFVDTTNRYELRNGDLLKYKAGLINESGQSDKEHIEWLTSYIHYAEIYKQLVEYYNQYGQEQNQSDWFLTNIIYCIKALNKNQFKLYYNDDVFVFTLNQNDPTLVDKFEGKVIDYDTNIEMELDKYNLKLNIEGPEPHDFKLVFTCQIDNFKLTKLPEKFKELIDTLKNIPDYM